MELHEGSTRTYLDVEGFVTEGGIAVALDHEGFDYTMTAPEGHDSEHLYDVEQCLKMIGLEVDDYEPPTLNQDGSLTWVLVPAEPEEIELWQGFKPIALPKQRNLGGKAVAGLVMAGLTVFSAIGQLDSLTAVLPT